jgi:DNA modification methylase
MGDAASVLREEIEPRSVQTVVTSPPYWGLRKYATDSPDEIGREISPEAHVSTLVEVYRRVKDALRDDGTVWINYGFKYVDGRLLRLPGKLADALEADGWYMKSAVVWAKGVSFLDEWSGSVMPESVNGWRWERCRVKVKERADHEMHAQALQDARGYSRTMAGLDARKQRGACDVWRPCPGCEKCCDGHGPDFYVLRQGSWRPTSAYEMVFLLAKSDRYFSDAERVREPLLCPDAADGSRVFGGTNKHGANVEHGDRTTGGTYDSAPPGRNPRNVWAIGTSGTARRHYAAYPEELVEPCVRASTSKTACSVCGASYAPVVERGGADMARRRACGADASGGYEGAGKEPPAIGQSPGEVKRNVLAGMDRKWVADHWPTCEHDDDSGRCIVLDPFCGTSTTGVVALREGCDYIGIDVSEEYLEMSRLRLLECLTGVSERELERGQTSVFAAAGGQ